jgi:hypothetical protein
MIQEDTMSSDQGKKQEQIQQASATETQKIESAELTDADLDKVSGGGAQPHMLGTLGTTVTGAPPDPVAIAFGSNSLIK